MFDIEPDEFRPTERAGEADEGAWSRMPAVSSPQTVRSCLISVVAKAADRRGGSPGVRPVALSVSRMAGFRVSSGCLAMRCARDGGHPAPQRRQGVAVAGVGQVGADALGCRRHRVEVAFAHHALKLASQGVRGLEAERRLAFVQTPGARRKRFSDLR
jgi:hypothetical protein